MKASTIVLAIAVLVGGVSAFLLRVSGKMPDLDVYLRAGQRAAAAEPLYRADDGHYQFKYLPAFAILAAPLAILPPPVARPVWFTVSVAALGFLLLVGWKLLPDLRGASALSAASPHGPPRPVPATSLAEAYGGGLIVALTVAVLAKFFARELVLGQVNAMFALAAAAALLAMRHRKNATAGAMIALAIVLKPYGAVLLPWLACRRRRTTVVTAIGGLALALAAPSMVYGLARTLSLHRDWWTTVVTTTEPNLTNPDNVSWLAMYTRLLGETSPWPEVLALATVIAAVAVFVLVWQRRDGLPFPEGLEGSLLLLWIPFVSPQGWDYVLLVATPAVMYVLALQHQLPVVVRILSLLALVVTALTIYDVIGRTAYLAFLSASGLTIAFAFVAAGLVTLRLRRVA
jgi:hypothetical protein